LKSWELVAASDWQMQSWSEEGVIQVGGDNTNEEGVMKCEAGN